MKKVFILVTSLVIGLTWSNSAFAAVKPGSKCPTKNQIKIGSNKKYTCIKSGNKLVWSKGSTVSKNEPKSSSPITSADEIESLPVDVSLSLGVDLKGAGQGKGLAFVPYGFDFGSRGEGAVGSGTINPQPAFYAPIGTDVLAIKSGTVIKITKIWSNDFNIMVTSPNDSKYIWEVEHVIDVKVKEGDKVNAGQPIAKVGDFDERYSPGIGLVEFGLLINSNGPPTHICPFTKIAKVSESKIVKDLNAIIAADKGRGYDSGSMAVLGCNSLAKVEG